MNTYTLLLYRNPHDPDEPHAWYGIVPAVRGVISDGDSLEEAVTMTTDALEGMLEVILEHRQALPENIFDLAAAKQWASELFGDVALEFETREAKIKIGVNALAA